MMTMAYQSLAKQTYQFFYGVLYKNVSGRGKRSKIKGVQVSH